jgi:hypothetical protein
VSHNEGFLAALMRAMSSALLAFDKECTAHDPIEALNPEMTRNVIR